MCVCSSYPREGKLNCSAVAACGPEALANEVAEAATPYLSSAVKVDIARFEC